jgi:hypothetical protein
MKGSAWALALLAGAACAFAQEGSLDVLDGETLYEGGWLFTLGHEFERREGLRRGRDRVSDPLERRLDSHTAAFGAHYGLRYNVQLSAIIPYVHRALTLEDPAGPDRVSEEGLGDLAAVVKWRFLRLDEVGRATNFAVLAGLELPTGDDDPPSGAPVQREDFQIGSGSWDPFLGAAVTHEPGRWRFNAAVLYQHNGQGTRDFKAGDELFAELAAGNRFWLEPYPGPFMRFDALLRYRHAWKARQDGDAVRDSGGDVLTAGATLAFRPRPTLDFQIFLEYPIYRFLEGTQLEEDWSVFFAFGLRI